MSDAELMKKLESLVKEWRDKRFDHEKGCDCDACMSDRARADELEVVIWNRWGIPLRKGA